MPQNPNPKSWLEVNFSLKGSHYIGETTDVNNNKLVFYRADLWDIHKVKTKKDLIKWFEVNEYGYTTYSFNFFKKELERVKYVDTSLFGLQFTLITFQGNINTDLIQLELWVQGEEGEATFRLPLPLSYESSK